MAIPIVPSLFVGVLPVRRKELIEPLGQILLKTRFKLNRPNCPGASDVMNVYETGLDV